MREQILLDTDILSLTRRADRHPEIIATLRSFDPEALFLSTITLMELERGIAAQQRRDPEFARDLAQWRDRTVAGYGAQILSFDTDAAVQTGRLIHQLGYMSPDLQIAGIALSRGMKVATLNRRNFEPTGCQIVMF